MQLLLKARYLSYLVWLCLYKMIAYLKYFEVFAYFTAIIFKQGYFFILAILVFANLSFREKCLNCMFETDYSEEPVFCTSVGVNSSTHSLATWNNVWSGKESKWRTSYFKTSVSRVYLAVLSRYIGYQKHAEIFKETIMKIKV